MCCWVRLIAADSWTITARFASSFRDNAPIETSPSDAFASEFTSRFQGHAAYVHARPRRITSASGIVVSTDSAISRTFFNCFVSAIVSLTFLFCFLSRQINHPYFAPPRHMNVQHLQQMNRNQPRRNDNMRPRNELVEVNRDEYAGLMTNREKQWLLNIQLLQLNTGTPYFDDYYYTVSLVNNLMKESH